ncbi:hypothetical protein SBADM41S_06071 [Streptomyces badius]
MSQIVVKRPPRALPTEVPVEQVQLQPPPELPRGQQEGALMQLLPMLGMGGSVVFFFMTPNPIMRIMGMIMIASTLGMAVAMLVRYRRGTQGELADLRRDYLKYLTQTRRTVLKTARKQRDAQFYLHPSPDQLWALVAEGSRVWERRAGDADFAQVRIGLGSQELATPLIAPETAPVDELEPLAAGAMQQFLATHSTLDGLPMAVSLRAFYHLTISGHAESARSAARAMVGGLASLHSPEDLVIAVATGTEAAPQWEWAKWLPHAQASGPADGAGTRRLITTGLPALEELLAGRLEGRPRFQPGGQPLVEQPHVVVVLDGESVAPMSVLASAEGLQGVTVIEVVPGEVTGARGGLSIVVQPKTLRLESGQGLVYDGVPDLLSYEAAEALARQLAPLHMASGGDDDEPLLANLEFTDLLNLGDAASIEVSRTSPPADGTASDARRRPDAGHLKDQLMNRLELRLGDPMDSELDRKVAANVPAGVPGRGQTPEKLHFMAAVPRIDGINSDSDLSEATAAMNQEVTRHWTAPPAPAVRLLPRELPASELPAGYAVPERGIAFGIDENNLEPVYLNFEQDPFFLAFGESESGKSNLLRLIIKQLTERYDGDSCKLFVIDNRRSLLDVTPRSHLAEYIPMSNNMEHHMTALYDLMKRRTPSADVTAQELRDQSWWQGPTVYVVIDDFDLVATSSGNPLAPITEMLPFARDVGVRFIIARSSAGASRALYEPFLQRMIELGAQGLMLSGDPGEGDIMGNVRPRPMPPGRGIFVTRRRGNPLVQAGLMGGER